MPERVDIAGQDYMVNLSATSSQIGPWIPLAGTWGWSFTVASNGNVNGTLNIQATDFGPSTSGFPQPPGAYSLIGDDTLNVSVSSGGTKRIGKGYDSIWNTPRFIRATWTNSSSSASTTIWVAYTLKHQ